MNATSAEDSSSWESCGIVRTGAVAKGLLLHGEKYFDLVIVCKDKPTRWNVTLLSLTLPDQLKVSCLALSKDLGSNALHPI